MKLHGPSCREFHLTALTCFLAKDCKAASTVPLAAFRRRDHPQFAFTRIVAVAAVSQPLRTVAVTATLEGVGFTPV